MGERREQHDGDDATGAGSAATNGDACDGAGATVNASLVPELALEDYAAMLGRATSLRDIAHELRAILWGVHPYADCDGRRRGKGGDGVHGAL